MHSTDEFFCVCLSISPWCLSLYPLRSLKKAEQSQLPRHMHVIKGEKCIWRGRGFAVFPQPLTLSVVLLALDDEWKMSFHHWGLLFIVEHSYATDTLGTLNSNSCWDVTVPLCSKEREPKFKTLSVFVYVCYTDIIRISLYALI